MQSFHTPDPPQTFSTLRARLLGGLADWLSGKEFRLLACRWVGSPFVLGGRVGGWVGGWVDGFSLGVSFGGCLG